MRITEKDAVAADNQINAKFRIQFMGSDKPDKKVLILGNSITYHGEKDEIGWHGNWGMAASSAARDYVHILFETLKNMYENIQFCIAQVSSLEIDFCNKEHMKDYAIIKDYSPDITVLRFGENIKPSAYDMTELEENYDYFIKNYLMGDKTNLIFTTRFMKDDCIDGMIRKCSVAYGGITVELGDLGDDDNMKAIGKFEHAGVQDHPGDLGMKTIAERIYSAVKDLMN